MMSRIEHTLRKMRRWISRSEWGVLMLKLPRSEGTEADAGIIMVQIDGLSHSQFKRALREKRMPFLSRLISREGYHLRLGYSGVPSTTAAVQGEFFYGYKSAVPAYGFRNRETGQQVEMTQYQAATAIEEGLTGKGPGLLAGGSSYCNIYSGGAGETHICGTSKHWIEYVRAVNPFYLVGLIVLHGRAIIRVLALMAVEFIIAMREFIFRLHGTESFYDFLLDLLFVPKRVLVSVLMREFAVIGSEIDATRGLPVIHLNLLGYDEQAHRRGPDSAFAHWSLQGIDDAIRRLATAARHSHRRDYDIWIYSDHGQEQTIPYSLENGREIDEAIAGLFGEIVERRRRRRRPAHAVDWMGSKYFAPFAQQSYTSVNVTAIGPIGYVYTKAKLSFEEKKRIAKAMVHEIAVPLVVILPDESSGVEAWAVTRDSWYKLPEDRAALFGASHPFIDEIANDLIATALHKDAGDFLISGWRKNGKHISFVFEHGAHGGPGGEETSAFSLLPPDAPLADVEGRNYIRPMDLRVAAMIALKREPVPETRRPTRTRQVQDHLRIMTYNVHSCIGMDGKLSPARIARVIARYSPDIVALQELDVGRKRTRGMDQAHLIARELEMDFHFHPSLSIEEEFYGDAILSRYPMRLRHAGPLPGLEGVPHLEPRGALWVTISIDGNEINVFNTHFGLSRKERLVQGEALLGPEWIGNAKCDAPIILCGDLNAVPESSEYKRMQTVLRDTQMAVKGHKAANTWLTRYPVRRLDYVFTSPEIAVRAVQVPRTELTSVASDHFPLITEISL